VSMGFRPTVRQEQTRAITTLTHQAVPGILRGMSCDSASDGEACTPQVGTVEGNGRA